MKWEDILKISLQEATRIARDYALSDYERDDEAINTAKQRDATKKFQGEIRADYRQIQELFKKHGQMFKSQQGKIREIMSFLNNVMKDEIVDSDMQNRSKDLIKYLKRLFRHKDIDFKTGKFRIGSRSDSFLFEG